MKLHHTLNSTCSVRGRYLYKYVRDRETRTSCSLQTATRTHCSKFVVPGLEHKDQWRENSGNILKLNGRDIPFVNNVTYLGVTFGKKIAWRHHMERTAAKDLRTYVRTYSLFKSGRLSTNIKRFSNLWLGQLWLTPVPPASMRRTLASWNCSACRTEHCALLEILTGAQQSTSCMWLSKFLTWITILLNYVGHRHN
jgi:hypothetical protein